MTTRLALERVHLGEILGVERIAAAGDHLERRRILQRVLHDLVHLFLIHIREEHDGFVEASRALDLATAICRSRGTSCEFS